MAANTQVSIDTNSFINSSQKDDLATEANRLRKEGTLCDVTLMVAERKFGAHRVILAATSPFFRGLFTTKMKESLSGEVKLDGVDVSVMDDVLQFIYTGVIVVTADKIESLAIAADFLMLSRLREVVEEFQKQSLTPTNCCSIKRFAEKYNCEALRVVAFQYISENFVEASKSDEFLSLDHKEVVDVISNDNIVVSEEEDVYKAVLRWVKHGYEDRKEHFQELFKYIRLPSVSRHYLAEYVRQEPLVIDNHDCTKALLDGVLDAYNLREGQLQVEQIPRKCLVTCEKAIVFCGKKTSSADVFCYFPSESASHDWKVLPSMITPRSFNATAVCDNNIYALLGSDSNGSSEFYVPQLNCWIKTADAPQNSREPALAVTLKGKIFVIGGSDSNSVMCYDPHSNKWKMVASMPAKRTSLCAVAVDNHIYAFGGYVGTNEKECCNSAEKYSPDSDEWVAIAPMKQKRSEACATVVNGKPFVVGGRNDSGTVPSCEVYDPEKNEWSEVCQTTEPRHGAAIARIAEKIYLVGGKTRVENGCETQLDTMECYNIKKKLWSSMSGNIPSDVQGHNVVKCGVLSLPKENFKPVAVPEVQNIFFNFGKQANLSATSCFRGGGFIFGGVRGRTRR